MCIRDRSKAAALRDTYNVTVLQQAKKLGKQLRCV